MTEKQSGAIQLCFFHLNNSFINGHKNNSFHLILNIFTSISIISQAASSSQAERIIIKVLSFTFPYLKPYYILDERVKRGTVLN